MALKQKRHEPVACDIVLRQKTPLSTNPKLTLEFVKFLMYQKGQIPVPYPQLKSYISSVKQEVIKFENEKSNLINVVINYFLCYLMFYLKLLIFSETQREICNDSAPQETSEILEGSREV